jgi:outer membrane lipoprotein
MPLEGRWQMSHRKLSGYLLLGMCVLFFISSCASPIAKRYRQEASPNVTYPMVFHDPNTYKGSIVIWGGMIIKNVPLKEGSELFILETPLGARQRPKGIDLGRGRFIAISQTFLDPVIYRKGRKVTLAGEVEGGREMVGRKSKHSYIYPVVIIKEIHLWEKRNSYPAYYYSPYYGGYAPYYWGPGWGDDFYFGGDFDEGFNGGDEGFGEGAEGHEEGR